MSDHHNYDFIDHGRSNENNSLTEDISQPLAEIRIISERHDEMFRSSDSHLIADNAWKEFFFYLAVLIIFSVFFAAVS